MKVDEYQGIHSSKQDKVVLADLNGQNRMNGMSDTTETDKRRKILSGFIEC